MRLLKMFFVLMIAAMAIGLSSCAKEEVSPPVVDGGASEMIYANASGEREDDPDEDCRCEFRFFSYENMPGSGNWSFAIMDASGMPDPEFEFFGTTYTDPFTGVSSNAFPSQYWDIPDDPSGVTFAFIDALGAFLQPNATLRIQIDCFTQNDNGTETLASTTYYEFIKSEATEFFGVYEFSPISTSCLTLIGL
jgi:hypothetical protein